MNFSNLLSEILRGQWALEIQTQLAHGAEVASLLNGTSDEFKPRDPWMHNFMSSGSEATGNEYDDAPQGSVAIVPLKGTMLKYGTLCSYGTREIAGFLSKALSSKKIAAVVLDIDSGGGSVNSIPPMMDVIRGSSKPVVALCDTAASAAYWTASGCDHIMADNGISSGFGSIGVVTSFVDMQPYWELQGIKFHTIYAPESEHKNEAFEKALKGDYKQIKSEILSPLARKFQNHVKKARAGKLNEDVTGILTGKMFFAEDALEHGLIDSIGNMQAAVNKALDLAEVRKFMKSK